MAFGRHLRPRRRRPQRARRLRGYQRVAREVYGNVDSMIAARARYGRVTAPVTLRANLSVLRGAQWISLLHTGHFAALEQPERVAEILLDAPSA
jgi:pimeloyl-ACP methyl ester carboxylesterase